MRIIFYLTAITLAMLTVLYALESSSAYEAIAASFSMDGRINFVKASLLEGLTLGLYSGGTDIEKSLALTIQYAEENQSIATMLAWVLFGLSCIFLFWGVFPDKQLSLSFISAPDVVMVSLLFLVIGLIVPVMSLTAYKEVPVLGFVVFKFESKSIVLTIYELFKNGSWFISCLVLIFSLLVPLLKTVLSLIAYNVCYDKQRSILRLLTVIGKWSMADVFIVAILLALFAAGSDESTDAELGQGLYFFAGYCILSMLALHCIQAQQNNKPI